ncbi:hypothetical protein SKAU_G00361060 [Synaphobranchus kaupii]|uniref:Uncharacterized protein n=1 Tax=Synaphobranchus kaupii TaxID=118154 RepID=A0A9Q1EID5_SYNKA|nr:hypothetical protein SKAU_G00361060 [Synaphobranchus kaupii]
MLVQDPAWKDNASNTEPASAQSPGTATGPPRPALPCAALPPADGGRTEHTFPDTPGAGGPAIISMDPTLRPAPFCTLFQNSPTLPVCKAGFQGFNDHYVSAHILL